MTRQARHRTVIAQKERQIGKLRDEVERLRKILLERDTEPVKTGKPFYLKPKYRKNYIPKNRDMETLENRDKEKPMNEKTREPMVIAL